MFSAFRTNLLINKNPQKQNPGSKKNRRYSFFKNRKNQRTHTIGTTLPELMGAPYCVTSITAVSVHVYMLSVELRKEDVYVQQVGTRERMATAAANAPV